MGHVVLPELGEGIKCATVAFWHVKAGDFVNEEDDLLEVVTDKASFNVSAGKKGKVKKIYIKLGDEVKVGETLALIEKE